MKKTLAQKSLELLPDFFANIKDWSKEYFDKHAQDLLDNSSGTVGLVIKTVGKSFIDNYFESISKQKLENYGLSTYVKAAYNQAISSVSTIESSLESKATIQEVSNSLEEVMAGQLSRFDINDTFLVFQPKYHPGVIYVKLNFINLLNNLKIEQLSVVNFIKDFNENIETQVKKEFGDDYEAHIAETVSSFTHKHESDFLLHMISMGKIGFGEGENLKYETTYGKWKDVHKLHKDEKNQLFHTNTPDREAKEYQAKEAELRPVTDLIDDYFNESSCEHIEKILFIVADFGKGKSVFLKNHAANLAKKYLQIGEGYFPVYFNLRDFSKYSASNSSLGVINDYLHTKHKIKIDSEYYINKKYVFLIDSLDESGDLSKPAIDKVIESIKRIQNLDQTKFRENKIIITTRPFDGGLESILHNHNPHTAKNNEGRDISQFISLFGFKKPQFNDWLNETIKGIYTENFITNSDFTNKIIEGTLTGSPVDIYSELIKTGTLSREELRRPIFAYMIYQLIINNVDFLKVGKIGVYLSFLNLLSKEAKHINDPGYKVNLNDEFGFRNMLHVISSLWMFERHQGKQGALKKADICRVLDKENKNEEDSTILERYKNKGVTEIQFLSHSYFGENNNTLHFQHQSFAEILLAEYYLKVFITYALEKTVNVEEARTKLFLGTPTEQTVIFFSELLTLLRETSVDGSSEEVIEKRKLLFPLFASLATEKNNSLFCNSLYYQWFNRCTIEENQVGYPAELLNNWCISAYHINKIISLAKEIINSNDRYYLAKSESKSALYNNELILTRNNSLKSSPVDIDKWLALMVGNKLYNSIDSQNSKLFNKDYSVDYNTLLEMITSSPLLDSNLTHIPQWGYDLFQGLNMQSNSSLLSVYKYIPNINLSNSYFKNIQFVNCVFAGTNFTNCTFDGVHMHHSFFFSPVFKNINCINKTYSGVITIENRLVSFDILTFDKSRFYLPTEQNERLFIPKLDNSQKNDYEIRRTSTRSYRNILTTLSNLITSNIINKGHKIEHFEHFFSFEDPKDRISFFKRIKHASETQIISNKIDNNQSRRTESPIN